MIQLYTNNTQDFSKNGIILNPITCVISPKLNGENELEMEIILDTDGLYKNITRSCLVTVPTPDFAEDQIYEIYNTKKSMSSNTLVVYARHIFFSLGKKVIFNKNVQGNGQQVLSKLLEDTKFKGTSNSNITDIRQYKMKNIVNVLNGNEEDSFLNIWGGEIECNNYNLNIPLKRGSDKGVRRVTFGYSLEDIEEDLNADEIVTRIFPYSGDLVLSGNTPYVDSPFIAKYQDVYEQSIEMSDIKVKEKTKDSEGNDTTSKDAEGFETRAEAEAEMIKRCKKLYDDGADKIKANYVVKMQELSKTIEYKQLGYDVLEEICLGDTVHCYNKNIDIEVSARCISYKWDCIKEEFIEIELGQFISNYMDNNLNDLDNLYRKIILEKQYILLRVDSLDNTMHSEIKITEEGINENIVNTKKGLETTITKTAEGINATITDLKDDTEAKINANSKEISLKVSKGDDFSTEMKQNVNAFQFLFNKAGEYKTEIDSSGITIYQGGVKVKNKNGTTVMWVNSSGVVMLNDLYFDNAAFEEGSNFASSLANMKKLSLQKVSISGKLIIDEHNFYLYKDGEGGYDLEDYVNRRIREFCKDQGWKLT